MIWCWVKASAHASLVGAWVRPCMGVCLPVVSVLLCREMGSRVLVGAGVSLVPAARGVKRGSPVRDA